MAKMLTPVRSVRRINRNPRHTFYCKTRPWQIQPMMIAPVLPHETLKNMLFQARVVTNPIANPLIGWWQEFYFFYVKLTDLDDRDTFTAMMLDLNLNADSLIEADNRKFYTSNDQIPFVKLCLKRVVEEYFRDEGEVWNGYTIDGVPVAAISPPEHDNLTNSLIRDDTLTPLPDVDVDANTDGTITIGEIDQARRTYDFMRANALTNATWEDWLSTYGVRPKKEQVYRPERIRNVSQWSYPSNTINPTDGSPSSAVSWSIAERADKDRYFREPGFICGYSITRPKVYMQNLRSAGAGMLNDALSWLPAILRDDAATSLKQFADMAGPVKVDGDDDGYWIDVRDLLVYGDQFLNVSYSVTGTGQIALPQSSMQHKYANDAMATSLFVSSASQEIIMDGVVDFTIASAVEDATDITVNSVA